MEAVGDEVQYLYYTHRKPWSATPFIPIFFIACVVAGIPCVRAVSSFTQFVTTVGAFRVLQLATAMRLSPAAVRNDESGLNGQRHREVYYSVIWGIWLTLCYLNGKLCCGLPLNGALPACVDFRVSILQF